MDTEAAYNWLLISTEVTFNRAGMNLIPAPKVKREKTKQYIRYMYKLY